jgi:hypothetical protein
MQSIRRFATIAENLPTNMDAYIKWTQAMVLAATTGAVVSWVETTKMDASEAKLAKMIIESDMKTSDKIAALDTKIAALDTKIAALDTKLMDKLMAMDKQMMAMDKQMMQQTMAMDKQMVAMNSRLDMLVSKLDVPPKQQ